MWQTKRKVADGSANSTSMKLDVASTGRNKTSRRIRGGNNKKSAKAADRQIRKIFDNLGASIESLIDATPLGVQTPEPWNPDEDKKKAFLSNPASVLKVVTETIDAFAPYTSKFLGKMDKGSSSAWMMTSNKFLMSLREGFANAMLAERRMDKNESMEGRSIDVPADVTVSSEAGEFVDLGADQWGNSIIKRSSNPVKEAVSEAKAIKKVCQSKILKIIDNLTLRANGIVVTSDDASVECSISSDVVDHYEAVPGSGVCSDDEDDDFEECPSVITELAAEDELEEDIEEEDTKVEEETPTEDLVLKEETQESKVAEKCSQELVSDEEEYVMTEEPDSEDEDFVDLKDEFDMSYRS